MMNFQEWLKGGLRYQRLRKEVDRQLQAEGIVMLFIGVQARVGALFALNPLSVFRNEFVVALTDHDVAVLKVKRPAIFGSKVMGIWYRAPQSALSLHGKEVVVEGEAFTPLPFHRKDAEEMVRLART